MAIRTRSFLRSLTLCAALSAMVSGCQNPSLRPGPVAGGPGPMSPAAMAPGQMPAGPMGPAALGPGGRPMPGMPPHAQQMPHPQMPGGYPGAQVAYHSTIGGQHGPGCQTGGCPCFPGSQPPSLGIDRRPWDPPQTEQPYPNDEYIYDGGDHEPEVIVSPDFRMHGLQQEDTVVHYDTLDGKRKVTASNRVPIYAPRFAAARKIYGIDLQHSHTPSLDVDHTLYFGVRDRSDVPSAVKQPLEVTKQVSTSPPHIFLDETKGLSVTRNQIVLGFDSGFLPHEDFNLIRRGIFDRSEKAQLNKWLQAATTWAHDHAAAVTIDRKKALVTYDKVMPNEAVVYELPPGKSRVRLVKVASIEHALPGDIIDFTLRFDNVGDQPIGNVTIADNLTTRLTYVEDSAQCSVDANFVLEENEGETHILRWEITEPLEVGEGGVIRFQCKVR